MKRSALICFQPVYESLIYVNVISMAVVCGCGTTIHTLNRTIYLLPIQTKEFTCHMKELNKVKGEQSTGCSDTRVVAKRSCKHTLSAQLHTTFFYKLRGCGQRHLSLLLLPTFGHMLEQIFRRTQRFHGAWNCASYARMRLTFRYPWHPGPLPGRLP